MWLKVLLLLGALLSSAWSKPLRVGSKNFTENVILGEILTQALQMESVEARHRAQLGGTRVLWEALLAGEIDLYSDYSGTLEQEILHLPSASRLELEQALGNQGIGLSLPWGFNNSYALGMRAELATRMNIRCISDLLAHPELRFGFGNEFLSRQDGWPALRATYGLAGQTAAYDHDLAYRALAAGQIDVTDVYATDAEIEVHKLTLLEDDRGHFPRYDALILYRLECANDPAVTKVFKKLTGHLDTAAMRRLNRLSRIEGKSEIQVASHWLGLKNNQAGKGPVHRLLSTTQQHLQMVLAAVALSAGLGLPLGVACYLWQRTGRVILGIVAMIQTIPSLALLVFLIPICGLGASTAVVALTLYGLLPIVQGTYNGLQTIPEPVKESARALGLSRSYRWRHIDFPLALPSIVAGIQTTAVIAVGTATLAALIGGGGYGEPILTGVRLARTDLLLEGAVPAALMALLIQLALALLYRRVCPP